MSGPGFDLARFAELPVLGIIRGATPDSVHGVMEACISAGLRFIEFTLNSEEALAFIEAGARDFPESLCIGAGTVSSVADADRAVNAGARFLVSPTLNEDVASYCRERELAYFPGALTPTEIEKAWNAGATMVKVFPASQMGPKYFNTLSGPFDKIRLMAVGGVGPANVHDYLRAGASAVAVGGSVMSPERMKNKEFAVIRQEISEFLLAVKSFYSRIS
ncbi:MAG: bifunctional 4-hydroxy-2-oxoglutarate aldolase/2-dehydro-3-deoxy-phosphogluconate aldolase [Nitrospinae bacterium]|nr:bifunctional 4-hydroxy-2-oxoglutarate aldolase/2-dehydro-3-deoxy-phosphogluconate aldolase [Nitrospinota bacterium]